MARRVHTRIQTIADVIISTTDGQFVLAKMGTGKHVKNRLRDEIHVPGTGVSHVADKDIPRALRSYVRKSMRLKVLDLELICLSNREPDDRFVRHIHYKGRVNLTAKEVEKTAQARLDLSEVIVVSGCRAKELISKSPVAFERTPTEVQRCFSN